MNLTKRAVVTVSIVAVGLVGIPAAAGTARPERLGRVNELEATGAAAALVEIPDDVVISNPILGPKQFSIHGGVRFAGFALMPAEGGEGWVGGRLPSGDGYAHFFVSSNPLDGFEARYTVPAGTYRLFVLSSDPRATTRVELRLDELSGRSEVRASAAAPFEIRFPEVAVDAGGQLHSFSATGRFTSRSGLLFGGTWYSTPFHAETRWEGCFYDGPPPERFRERGAGCAAEGYAGTVGGVGAFDHYTGVQVQSNPHRTAERYVNFVPTGRLYVDGENWLPGRFGIVESVATAAAPEDVQAVAFWLGL